LKSVRLDVLDACEQANHCPAVGLNHDCKKIARETLIGALKGIRTMPQIDAGKAANSMTSQPANSDLLEMCQPIIEGMAQYNGALCDGFAAIGTEWLNFMNRRLHGDMLLAGRLAQCGSPQDLMQEWATFMSTTAEDYRTEFARLTEMNAAASQRAISSVRTNGQAQQVWPPRNS
jgi:hypothetical protein